MLPKATIFPDSLVVLDGDKRVAGSKPQAQALRRLHLPPELNRIILRRSREAAN